MHQPLTSQVIIKEKCTKTKKLVQHSSPVNRDTYGGLSLEQSIFDTEDKATFPSITYTFSTHVLLLYLKIQSYYIWIHSVV